MSLPTDNWENKKGTGERVCPCGTWASHWLNYSGKRVWPTVCSLYNYSAEPTLGAHIINAEKGIM